MESRAFKDISWERLRAFLPFDLDGLAIETGMLTRRRGITSGEDLARVLLMSALPGATNQRVSEWARTHGLAKMNTTATFARLSRAEPFLIAVLESCLTHAASKQADWKGFRLLAVDATFLSGPASKGHDQVLHVVYNLISGSASSLELTSHHGAESLVRHSFNPGDLVLADRGYGLEEGVRSLLLQGARVLVRCEFHCNRFQDASGRRISPEQASALIPSQGTAELLVTMPTWETPLRIIGERRPDGKVVWLLTNLPPEILAKEEARDLYRRRWQVELFFKRLKSLLDLDELPSRDGPTSRPWILAKLILATLAVLATDERFSPWGLPEEEPLETIRNGSLDTFQSAPCSSSPSTYSARQETEGAKATCLMEA